MERRREDESGTGGARGAGPGPGRGDRDDPRGKGHGDPREGARGTEQSRPVRGADEARGQVGGVGGETSRLSWAMASGDPDAFARFYELWFDRVYAIARRATGRDEAFCLDVVQESFMKMIAKIKPIDSDAALAVWIKRVTTRTALDMIRAEHRRTAREERKGASIEPPGEGAADDPGARLAWLESELAQLEREEAEMVLARHRFGWTLKAIGETFGLSPGAVDGRISRIVARLRDRAQEDREEEGRHD